MDTFDLKKYLAEGQLHEIITDSLFALLILSLGVKAGSDAVNVLAKGNVASGTVSGLKAALKGKDLSALIKDIAGAVA